MLLGFLDHAKFGREPRKGSEGGSNLRSCSLRVRCVPVGTGQEKRGLREWDRCVVPSGSICLPCYRRPQSCRAVRPDHFEVLRGRGLPGPPSGAGGIPCSRASIRTYAAVNGDSSATSLGLTPARRASIRASTNSCRASCCRASALRYCSVARRSACRGSLTGTR